MTLLKIDPNGENKELSDVPAEFHGAELVEFARAASERGFFTVLGTKLLPEVTGGTPVYQLFAFDGRVVTQNIVLPG